MTLEVRRVRAQYMNHNALLHLALGLVASFGAFERLLATYAPEGTKASSEAAAEGEAVYFLLGLLALRSSVEACLGEAAVPTSAVGASTVPAGDAPDERRESLWR